MQFYCLTSVKYTANYQKCLFLVLKWVEIWYFSETEESKNEIIQFFFDPARGT